MVGTTCARVNCRNLNRAIPIAIGDLDYVVRQRHPYRAESVSRTRHNRVVQRRRFELSLALSPGSAVRLSNIAIFDLQECWKKGPLELYYMSRP